MTPADSAAAEEFRVGLRGLAALAAGLGLALWVLAAVYRRRGPRRHVPVQLIGGALALTGGAYLLWALP